MMGRNLKMGIRNQHSQHRHQQQRNKDRALLIIDRFTAALEVAITARDGIIIDPSPGTGILYSAQPVRFYGGACVPGTVPTTDISPYLEVFNFLRNCYGSPDVPALEDDPNRWH